MLELYANAFPGSNTSFLQAVEDGFQGTLEDFLKLQSIPQSDRPITGELDIKQDMKAIEGQTASKKALEGIAKIVEEPEPFEKLLRSSDELIQRFKNKTCPREQRS